MEGVIQASDIELRAGARLLLDGANPSESDLVIELAWWVAMVRARPRS